MAWISQPLASYLFRRLLLRRQVPEKLEAHHSNQGEKRRGPVPPIDPTAGDLGFRISRLSKKNHRKRWAQRTKT